MARRKRQRRTRRANRGELPGEDRKRSVGSGRTGSISEGGRGKEEHYIVKTARLDKEWRVEVEHGSESYALPSRVILQIKRHMESIITQERRDRAIERAQQLVQGNIKGLDVEA